MGPTGPTPNWAMSTQLFVTAMPPSVWETLHTSCPLQAPRQHLTYQAHVQATTPKDRSLVSEKPLQKWSRETFRQDTRSSNHVTRANASSYETASSIRGPEKSWAKQIHCRRCAKIMNMRKHSNLLSEDNLLSLRRFWKHTTYQAAYFPITNGSEIIPDNILCDCPRSIIVANMFSKASGI